MIRSKAKLAITALLAGVAACTSLPDTSGYTLASVQLKNSAVAAGAVLHSELGRLADQVPADQHDRAARLATGFDRDWQTTIHSLDAMAHYAESIEEITKAGNSGGEAARAIAGSVSTLANSLGVIPGAAAVGVATDTFALLNTALANMRAARSLERSLDIADPLIQDMTGVVAAQVAHAKAMFGNAITLERRLRSGEMEEVLTAQRLLEAADGTAALRLAALNQQPGRDAERRVAEADLKRIRDGLAALAPRMTAYNAAVETLAARERAANELFAATDAAVASWREGHQKLVRAIRERRPVSFQSLAGAAQDVRGLLERWRNL